VVRSEMNSAANLLNTKLSRWKFLEECILWEYRSRRFGYSLDVSFNYIWDENGHIPDDILENPQLLTFSLTGVRSLGFSSDDGRDPEMNPGLINWGYGEVARVEAFDSPAGCGISAIWEGHNRRLAVEFDNYILLSPEGHPI
jgi:hypothetical protein